MILRGAITSSEARVLDAHCECVAPVINMPEVVSLTQSAAEFVAETQEHYEPEPIRAVMAEPTRPVLTLEAVQDWLAVQDQDTRAACAVVLSEDLDELAEQARLQGHDEGRRAAQRTAEIELNSKIGLLSEVSMQAEQRFNEEVVGLSKMCVDIVAEAITKVAGKLLSTEEATIGAVKEVLGRVKEGRELTIRVNASDVEVLRAAEKNLAAALGARKYQLMGDPRVEIGGCIVESKLGSLDGRMEAQLRELFEVLRASKVAAAERS